jgi:hypothetical protein
MKKEFYPDKVPWRRAYGTKDMAILFDTCRATIIKKMEEGLIPYYCLPGNKSRYVLLEDLKAMWEADPRLLFIMRKIDWSKKIGRA